MAMMRPRGRPRLTTEQRAARDRRNARDVELLAIAAPVLGGLAGIARLVGRSRQWIGGAAHGRWVLTAEQRIRVRDELRLALERRRVELTAGAAEELREIQDLLSRIGSPSSPA